MSIVTTNARAPGSSSCCTPPGAAGQSLRRPHCGRPQGSSQLRSNGSTSTKGYRGHDAPHPRRVFISGQKRGVFGTIEQAAPPIRRRTPHRPHEGREGHLWPLLSRAVPAIYQTPSPPLPDTTSAASSPGSGCFCAPILFCQSLALTANQPSIRLLNEDHWLWPTAESPVLPRPQFRNDYYVYAQ